MAIVWPPTLPTPLEGNFQGGLDGDKIEFATDAGPLKSRARTTKPTVLEAVSLFLTGTQLATFRTFYTSTLGNGVAAFEWNDPTTGQVETAVIVGKPSWNGAAGGPDNTDRKFVLNINLEIR